MPFYQYNHLFAFGIIFAALDAYNIGANDVANSFATSVSSRSLTMPQACLAAAICEFGGAVLVGARVTGTIKGGIISLATFGGNPGLQMLGFTCALMASASWLMIATRMAWPVSTTYSIVSALAGVGVAAGGANAVNWGWSGARGLGAIWAGLIIAPSLAAGFGAFTFLCIKFIVLDRKRPLPWALGTGPVLFFGVSAVLTLSIVYKGAPSLNLDDLGSAGTAAAVVGTASVVCLFSIIFWLPFVYARTRQHNYNVRFYHIFLGPLIFKFVPVPADAGEVGARSAVVDYRIVRDGKIRTAHTDAADESTPPVGRLVDPNAPPSPAGDDRSSADEEKKLGGTDEITALPAAKPALAPVEDPSKIEGPWASPKNLYKIFRYHVPRVLTHGLKKDIHGMQSGDGKQAERMSDVYSRAVQHGNETETVFSFLQVMTACTASFAHGANDVSNAIGPLAAIYEIWRTSGPARSSTPVPIWILVFGGAFIVIGLATYGYNVMAVLGNRITLHSPSRGMSMELGAAITVIIASIYGIPVSTTMCITGATIGVGLCNWDFRAVNWRAIAWIYCGWILTIPIVGIASGCLFAFIARSPSL